MISIWPLIQEAVQKVQHMRVIPTDFMRFFIFILRNTLNPISSSSQLGNSLKNFNLNSLFSSVPRHMMPQGNGELISLPLKPHKS